MKILIDEEVVQHVLEDLSTYAATGYWNTDHIDNVITALRSALQAGEVVDAQVMHQEFERLIAALHSKSEALYAQTNEIESIRQQLAECERNMQDLNIRLGLEIGRKNEQLAAVTKERDELAALNARMLVEYEARMKERDELVEAVLAVCCDPKGRVVIRGSDGDRAVLQAALAKIGADKTGEV